MHHCRQADRQAVRGALTCRNRESSRIRSPLSDCGVVELWRSCGLPRLPRVSHSLWRRREGCHISCRWTRCRWRCRYTTDADTDTHADARIQNKMRLFFKSNLTSSSHSVTPLFVCLCLYLCLCLPILCLFLVKICYRRTTALTAPYHFAVMLANPALYPWTIWCLSETSTNSSILSPISYFTHHTSCLDYFGACSPTTKVPRRKSYLCSTSKDSLQ